MKIKQLKPLILTLRMPAVDTRHEFGHMTQQPDAHLIFTGSIQRREMHLNVQQGRINGVRGSLWENYFLPESEVRRLAAHLGALVEAWDQKEGGQ